MGNIALQGGKQMQEKGTKDLQLERITKKQGYQGDYGRTTKEPIPERSGTEQTYTQAMDEQEAPEQHNDGENEEIIILEAQMLDLTVDENRDTEKNGEQYGSGNVKKTKARTKGEGVTQVREEGT
jgi:hypothetical protein